MRHTQLRKTGLMAAKALELARSLDPSFVSVKTSHGPAVLRGFADAGFRTAEVTTCLSGPIADPAGAPASPRPAGIGIRPAGGGASGAKGILDALGDLFYDGHHLHGPFLPEGFSGRLWRMVAERDLASPDCPSLVAVDTRRHVPVDLAVGTVSCGRGALTILPVAGRGRGQGLGRALLAALSREFWERGRGPWTWRPPPGTCPPLSFT